MAKVPKTKRPTTVWPPKANRLRAIWRTRRKTRRATTKYSNQNQWLNQNQNLNPRPRRQKVIFDRVWQQQLFNLRCEYVDRIIVIVIFFSLPELWAYLKDTVCSNNPLSVDDLVDKLMTAVTAIPQPLLNSVVKDTIKKQKSIDEGEWTICII